MANVVNWFQISGKDGASLAKFYKKVFDWKTSPGMGGMTMIASEKGGIPGGIQTAQDGRASIAVYAATADLKKHLAKVEKAGGKVALAPMDLGGGMGHIAGFLDPEGNWMGLWQEEQKPAKKATPASKAKKVAKKK